MEEKSLVKIIEEQRKKMGEVFDSISIDKDNDEASRVLSTAKDYYDDSKYFFEKGNYIDAFEAVIISWSFINVGIILGLFSVPDGLKGYFV